VASLPLVTKQFHIEDRARGQVVATGEIDANGHVIWDETQASVSEELSDLAEEIRQHIAAGHSGGQLRPPLEWFEL
jgi:predicted amidohydrolase